MIMIGIKNYLEGVVIMKKVLAVVSIFVLLTLVGIVLADNGGFSRPENNMMSVIIKGTTFGEKMYLGFTWLTPGGEVDVDVQKVKGNFTKSFTVPLYKIDKGNMECDYVASLWHKKVKKSKCKQGPCQYCRKNGYHMEGRGSSVRGTWSTR